MNNAIGAVEKRYSVRTYSEKNLSGQTLESIRTLFQKHSMGPFGNQIRFDLVPGEDPEKSWRIPGTYGVIKGAPYIILGKVRDRKNALIDYGYCLESIILELTEMGLGTCWIGGTFKKSHFAAKVDLKESEILPAVCPVGYPADRASLTDKFLRILAKSRKRKPWKELFFDGSAQNPLTPESAGKYYRVLESVRLGPSASNRQPWRIIKDQKSPAFHLFIKPDKTYQKLLHSIQNLDAGIALCHFELTAGEIGLKSRWEQVEMSAPSDWVYISSWVEKG
jgi:nitroreductase